MKLNSKIKRTGFVVLLIGLIILSIGLLQIAVNNDFSGFLSDLVRILIDGEYYYRGYKFTTWGTYISIIGLAFSFLYDYGIGKVINWVSTGK